MSKRRKYSIEFKQGAVEQARQPGVSCAQVARMNRVKKEREQRGKLGQPPADVQNQLARDCRAMEPESK